MGGWGRHPSTPFPSDGSPSRRSTGCACPRSSGVRAHFHRSSPSTRSSTASSRPGSAASASMTSRSALSTPPTVASGAAPPWPHLLRDRHPARRRIEGDGGGGRAVGAARAGDRGDLLHRDRRRSSAARPARGPRESRLTYSTEPVSASRSSSPPTDRSPPSQRQSSFATPWAGSAAGSCSTAGTSSTAEIPVGIARVARREPGCTRPPERRAARPGLRSRARQSLSPGASGRGIARPRAVSGRALRDRLPGSRSASRFSPPASPQLPRPPPHVT